MALIITEYVPKIFYEPRERQIQLVAEIMDRIRLAPYRTPGPAKVCNLYAVFQHMITGHVQRGTNQHCKTKVYRDLLTYNERTIHPDVVPEQIIEEFFALKLGFLMFSMGRIDVFRELDKKFDSDILDRALRSITARARDFLQIPGSAEHELTDFQFRCLKGFVDYTCFHFPFTTTDIHPQWIEYDKRSSVLKVTKGIPDNLLDLPRNEQLNVTTTITNLIKSCDRLTNEDPEYNLHSVFHFLRIKTKSENRLQQIATYEKFIRLNPVNVPERIRVEFIALQIGWVQCQEMGHFMSDWKNEQSLYARNNFLREVTKQAETVLRLPNCTMLLSENQLWDFEETVRHMLKQKTELFSL